MRNKFILVLSMLAATVFSAGHSYAQYVGPTNQNSGRTVADILKSPLDDQRVVLDGFISRKIGYEKYMFTDETGEILIDIDAEKFPTVSVDDKTKVQIHGNIDVESFGAPYIDVDAVIIK